MADSIVQGGQATLQSNFIGTDQNPFAIDASVTPTWSSNDPQLTISNPQVAADRKSCTCVVTCDPAKAVGTFGIITCSVGTKSSPGEALTVTAPPPVLGSVTAPVKIA